MGACTCGFYGTNCGQRCAARHYKISSSCDVQGHCVGGCEAGYHGQDCTQDCPAGFYGSNCFLRCTDRHCQSSSCLGDGACGIQCDAGWTLHDCTQECPNGTYGIKCNSACGHCADTNTCHHVTGACPGGCQAGWQLDLCHTELQMGSVITPTTAGIIGLAAGICIMLILGVGLHVCLVRQERFQWINASQKDVVKVVDTQEPVDRNTAQQSDNYTSLSEQAGGPNIYNNDYDAVDVEAKENSDYDVIKNKA
ncbi:multiple epidermal growth factor-like domains protein 10 [Haliotis rufescens]|uniref:multiple epidermal growth factor-like domains protein 10 n=1 Tax=Haliotis rufescens TaxID=6454 RepID=UPI00201F91B3|nr:multiple epidermal growth factor-like domains protein 10 [Haliotis rufescens]